MHLYDWHKARYRNYVFSWECLSFRFFCLNVVKILTYILKPKTWFAWKVKLKKNKLSLAIVDGKAAGENTKKIEKLIKASYLDNKNLDDKDWMHLRKIDKSKYDEVAKALKKMGIGELE